MLALLKTRAKKDIQVKESLELLDTRTLLSEKNIATLLDYYSLSNSAVIDKTVQVYKSAQSKETRFKNRSILSACVFIGCRHSNEAHTLKDICKIFKSKMKEVVKCYYTISKEQTDLVYNQKALVVSHVTQICEKLDLTNYYCQDCAIQVANEALDYAVISGRHPKSIAAASVFAYCQQANISMTLNKLADISGTNVNTIKHVANLIHKEVFGKNLNF